jgi:hypothetical protein
MLPSLQHRRQWQRRKWHRWRPQHNRHLPKPLQLPPRPPKQAASSPRNRLHPQRRNRLSKLQLRLPSRHRPLLLLQHRQPPNRPRPLARTAQAAQTAST